MKRKISLIATILITFFASCTSGEIMTTSEETVYKLELLLDHTRKLRFPETIDRELCKKISSELEYAERTLFLELGKKAWEDKVKEKK